MAKLIFLGLFLACVAICLAEECKNHNQWCHYKVRYGACKWNLHTRITCPRSCQSCKVDCPKLKPDERVECGHAGISQQDCFHAGCCWDPLEKNSKSPWCYKSKAKSTM